MGDIMKIEVDENKCVGHGICEALAEDVFEVKENGRLNIKISERPESDRERMNQAVIQCPAGALKIIK